MHPYDVLPRANRWLLRAVEETDEGPAVKGFFVDEMTDLRLRAQVNAYDDPDPSIHEPGFDAFVYITHADIEADLPADSDAGVVHLEGSIENFIGTERLDARVLGPLYTAAEDLLAQEPENVPLASAATKLRQDFLPGIQPRRTYRTAMVADIAHAIRARRKLRIVYARAWKPGVGERVIEPYRLVSTRRGFEVDAGPLDSEGDLRTFIISRIRDYEILNEPFTPPQDAIERSRAKRDTVTVSGVVPHSARWALNKYAERVTWLDDRLNDQDVAFSAEVLPPVADRVALMALSAGEGIGLNESHYDDALVQLAQSLWDHHGLGER